MSLKAELQLWSSALQAYDEQDFTKALDLFSRMPRSSKVLMNMGLIYAGLGDHETAAQKFLDATSRDKYLSVAYFECGVSNFLIGRFDLSSRDFQEALLHLRGHNSIDYDQLGLNYRLSSGDVLFNLGLCRIRMGQVDEGLADMLQAKQQKATDEQRMIEDAIQDRGKDYPVFRIKDTENNPQPNGVLYRPSEKKVKNAKPKDYMGKVKLIVANDSGDSCAEFTGVMRLNTEVTASDVSLDTKLTNFDPPLNVRKSSGKQWKLRRWNVRKWSARRICGSSPTLMVDLLRLA